MSEMKITIDCPLCESHELQVMDNTNNSIQQCISCGYSTSDINKLNDDDIENNDFYKTLDDNMKRWSKVVDGNIWVPSILNLPIGILYPIDNKKNEMRWAFAPVEKIPEEEQENYPDEGGGFFESKYAVEKQIYFDSFSQALIEIEMVSGARKEAKKELDKIKSDD
jgi:Zn ribbon nucleic-acid-binding protein